LSAKIQTINLQDSRCLILSKCRTCGNTGLDPILHLPQIPLVGDFLDTPQTHVDRFDIDLFFCDQCYLLQIAESIDSTRLFRDYAFSSSTVPGLVKHFEDYASWIKWKLNVKSILEVGSNDGVLLEPLMKFGYEVFGLDISENISQLAVNKGLNARVGKFSTSQIENLLGWCGRVDAITASNTFPHNSDPHDFLEAVIAILKPKGTLLLEVMYAGALFEQTQWDTVYHEHLNFHSLHSLSALLTLHGLTINHAEVIPMHAGSLRIVASSSSFQDSSVEEILKNEQLQDLTSIKTWQLFAQRAYKSIEICRESLELLSKTKSIWAYGASGRASMWLNACNLDFIGSIVDASPLRYGRYIPGTNTPIVPPTDPGFLRANTIFVTAWNYLEPIMKQHSNYMGEWVVPLPVYEIRKAKND
jgi:SAM-dependent methyltransferase